MRVQVGNVWRIGHHAPKSTVAARTLEPTWMLLQDGRARWIVDDQEFDVAAGHLVFLRRGQVWRFTLRTGEFIRYLGVRFDIAEQTLHDPDWLNLPTIMEVADPLYEQLVDGIVQIETELEQRRAHHLDAVHLLAQQLFLQLHRAALTQNKVRPVEVTRPTGSTPHHAEIIEDLARYVGQNLAADLSVGELAARYAISESHLRRVVRQWTGVSPKEYVTNARIDRARHLLLNRYTVTDAAATVGYPDPQYFSRVFRKHQGCTPTEFLRMHAARHYLGALPSGDDSG